MRRQEPIPTFKLPPASLDAGARTAVAIRSISTDALRINGSAPENGDPGAVSIALNLGQAEGTARRTHVALVELLHPKPMRDTIRLNFVVPKFDNDAVPFTDAAFEVLETMLLNAAGGFTRLADVEGAWRAPDGSIVRDQSRSYVVTVNAADAEAVARDIHAFIRSFFRQDAVFIETTPTQATAF